MAFNLQAFLQKSGRSLRVWNRTLSKASELESVGAVVEKNGPKALAKECDVLFSMMFDDAALKQICDEVAGAPPRKDLIWVDCSTVYPASTKEVAAKMQSHGVRFAACPMFGRPDAAKAKLLVGAFAGEENLKLDVRPYIEAMTRAIIDVGTEPHLGTTQKLCGNFFIASCIEMISEAVTLADKSGLSRQNVLDFINTMLPCPVIQGYGTRICQDNLAISPSNPGFPVKGGLKDVGLMRRLADETSTKLHIADVMYEHLEKQLEKGHGDLDWGSVVLSVREESGLPGEVDK
ncbi:uncharacterized protein SPPG_05586 [Spizellomyces punctatus DAOM BR117]|uniref:6-phosphogluconate dehydrogenase NADP-binding domain-containing protein n=1 Tax=Spizellomyces punctatus (strain DAOM BR117) TaxID=645134 RepID=A0A0L0HEY7_SPIPD|nr:uncharacterized protein SPPG_05586 [Spizellomyces punctatus DAOM BR117]KNC99338.1 hypothetical protein SPPG_05586 [Spizellomyces punctatus DAOM BR117]|eukprot:XP_016607378.1 hypothetical protein SPPG_05586 [Spizellomyces punctatus DAOM BR117]